MKVLVRTRAVGGSLVVTIPKEIADSEQLGKDELVQLEFERVKKSFFGAAKGVGRFTEEDEMKAHD